MDRECIKILIDNAVKGDVKAFERLIKEHQVLVFRLAFRLLCDEDDAKDILQETFIKVWIAMEKYNPQYSFTTWLYRIAANLCYDRLRSRKRSVSETIDNSVSEIASCEDIEQSLINKELKSLIIHYTSGLTPKQKLVFTLSDIEGLNASEISVVTGLSAAKIKSNLYLARKQIKEKINKATI
jgi:RNA polymerase sigma-70 factor (ECF subfamily)